LLIFDNADDINMWMKKDGHEDGSPALKEYLPRSSQGRIIFTTRSRKIAVKLAQPNVIEVSEMDEEMAELLLRKSLINPDLLNSRQDTPNWTRRWGRCDWRDRIHFQDAECHVIGF
jgi:hypothetical protein